MLEFDVARVRLAPIGLSALLFACGGDDIASTTAADGVSSIGIDDHGDGDGDPETSSGGSGGDKLDLGPSTTGSTADDGGDLEGCQKVDLLFVIDNSGSMVEEQAALVASFGGFVDGIQAQLSTAESYHVGVVTTDAYENNAPGCNTLGALVTQTGGDSASGQNCLPFSSGARYLEIGRASCRERV